MKLPTDRSVLECIFKMYEFSYPGPSNAAGRGANDPYISIDIAEVASRLGCNAELLFGRLYYHLDQKYRYEKDDGTKVVLFDIRVGEKKHAVQFPYLASILAGLNQESRRVLVPLGVSLFSLGVSLASFAAAVVKL